MNDELSKRLAELLRCVANTCDEEIDTLQFDDQAAQMAEALVQGRDLTPEIQHYLQNAPDCREEFFAMVSMLRALQEFETE